ncbi:MAG: hydrogenase maturation nickel metallochaperone HypA [Spirochaetota bacterium]
MHELSIAQQILDIIIPRAQKEGIQKITQVNLRVGELSSIVPHSLRFSFEVLSEGKMAQGATINIETVEPCFSCSRCGRKLPRNDQKCSFCGSEEIRITGGSEMEILSFEGD